MVYSIYTCTRCGDAYKGDYTEAAGHKPGDWIIDKEPTTDSEGSKLDAAALSQNEDAERRTLLEEVDKHLTDYDRAWMAAWKTLNARMTGYINETSMLLSGVKKATTENYIHINVDSDANPEQN